MSGDGKEDYALKFMKGIEENAMTMVAQFTNEGEPIGQ
jgi:hypothetical protein